MNYKHDTSSWMSDQISQITQLRVLHLPANAIVSTTRDTRGSNFILTAKNITITVECLFTNGKSFMLTITSTQHQHIKFYLSIFFIFFF